MFSQSMQPHMTPTVEVGKRNEELLRMPSDSWVARKVLAYPKTRLRTATYSLQYCTGITYMSLSFRHGSHVKLYCASHSLS